MEPSEYRRIMGHWATGVSVVATVTPEGKQCGMTANAFASLSLEPPLVVVCVEKNADTHDCIRSAGCFSVNVLDCTQERIARRFAAWEVARKFEGLAFRTEATGAPVLENALAWIDCRVVTQHEGGDHSIFVGRVEAGDAREGTPLLYYRGGYGRFTP